MKQQCVISTDERTLLVRKHLKHSSFTSCSCDTLHTEKIKSLLLWCQKDKEYFRNRSIMSLSNLVLKTWPVTCQQLFHAPAHRTTVTTVQISLFSLYHYPLSLSDLPFSTSGRCRFWCWTYSRLDTHKMSSTSVPVRQEWQPECHSS